MASRCPYRPTLPTATINRSTSVGVRCSRALRALLGTRLGGAAVWTFPFTGPGARTGALRKCLIVAVVSPGSFPSRAILGKVWPEAKDEEHG